MKDIEARQRRARQRDGHRMLSGVAGLDMGRVIVLVVMRRGLRMFVRRRSVTVFRMFVIRIRVRVQRGNLGGSANEGEADHDGEQALHAASLWKGGPRVKRGLIKAALSKPQRIADKRHKKSKA